MTSNLKFNRDMESAPFNRYLLVSYLYSKGDADDGEIHTMGFRDYAEDGNHTWHSYEVSVVDEDVVGWIDTYEDIK